MEQRKKFRVISEVSLKGGKKQKIFEDGKKEILFKNGVKRHIFPNGYTLVNFTNHDVK